MTADDDGVTWACRKCGVLVADRLLHDGHCPAQTDDDREPAMVSVRRDKWQHLEDHGVQLHNLLWRVVDAPRAATERGDVGVILPPGTWEEIAEAVGYDEMGG